MNANIQQWHAVGRRKSSVARVYVRSGEGKITINRREVEDYFPREALRVHLMEPLKVTDLRTSLDVLINVRGGGLTGQAGAIRLGLARALEQFDPNLRPPLKKAGLLTRDARVVERKKYGQPGARKRFQFSKR